MGWITQLGSLASDHSTWITCFGSLALDHLPWITCLDHLPRITCIGSLASDHLLGSLALDRLCTLPPPCILCASECEGSGRDQGGSAEGQFFPVPLHKQCSQCITQQHIARQVSLPIHSSAKFCPHFLSCLAQSGTTGAAWHPLRHCVTPGMPPEHVPPDTH